MDKSEDALDFDAEEPTFSKFFDPGALHTPANAIPAASLDLFVKRPGNAAPSCISTEGLA